MKILKRTCPAMVWKITRASLKPRDALNDLWEYNLCAPIVTPSPEMTATSNTETNVYCQYT